MKKTKVVNNSVLFCDDCDSVVTECDECHKTFKDKEEIYCFGNEWNHYCKKCGKEKSLK